jgi:hypothetical protein
VDGEFECFILEDRLRPTGIKVPGETAIPQGRYEIQHTYSPRFRRNLPLLINVPGFEGIRIHPGNKAVDTEGCLLPGQTAGPRAMVGNSVLAFNALNDKIVKAIAGGNRVYITILNPA